MITALLLTISLVLTGVVFHFAFAAPGRVRIRLRLTGAFYSFLVLSLVLAFIVWQEESASASLSRLVDPYPAVKEVSWVPVIPGEKTRSWVMKTVISAKSVAQFYRDARHRRDWQIEEAGTNVLILRKDGLCMHITASPNNGPGNGSTIIYTLKQDCQ